MKNKTIDISKLVRPNIAKLKPYSSARDEFKGADKDMIFLDANENPYDNGMNRYPDPNQTLLKEKIAEMKSIPSDHILLGNGSDEVLDLLFRAFCEPKKENILTFPPTYGMYQVLADINNVPVKQVLLDDNFQIDVEKALKVIDNDTKIIFICSPNNPSGNLMKRDRIIRILENFNGLVVIDEAYIDFSDSESWIRKINKYKNLIVTQTFSKALGRAGVRLGICYANKEIIDVLMRIKPPYNVNILSQKEGLETLDNYMTIVKQVNEIKISKEYLINELNSIGYIKKIYPSKANFLLMKVDDAVKRYEQIMDRGIVVRNRTSQPKCRNCLRITIGTDKQNTELLKVLKSI
jgi:histidinol-phosphate aminotransferase